MVFSEKENVLHAGPQFLHARTNVLGGKAAQTQTPGIGGSKFPKTPMRVPLKDENSTGARMPMTAKKSAVNQTIRSTPFITPAPGGKRQPLGGKDSNKRTLRRTPLSGGKGSGKGSKLQFPSHVKPSEGKVEAKTKVVGDDDDISDVEYIPPPVKDLPYDCSDGLAPKYSNMTPYLFQNCMRYYMQHVDENGKTKMQREKEAAAEKFVEKEQERADAWFRGECPSPPFFPAESKKKRTLTTKKSTSTLNKPTGASLRGGPVNKATKPAEKLSTVRLATPANHSRTRATSSVAPRVRSSSASSRTASISRPLQNRPPSVREPRLAVHKTIGKTPVATAPTFTRPSSRAELEQKLVEEIEPTKHQSTIAKLQEDMADYGISDFETDNITEVDLGEEPLDFGDNFEFEL
ncbi:hypothetical protein BJ508DRAFT_376278 [Ascobolus immersus RN42]|uniref:Uncharacterized protein n=1 Tax=Ascobolus immersus RN42 TaxID=1160509 RepID=A0A3N4I6L9_ASCIM|nr:hypothetical protein BJ508DRAFT_376278 [Ascobolus immersus RN42]